MVGELAALSSALVWAIASVLFTQLGARIRPLQLNLLKACVSLLLLPGTLFLMEGVLWPDLEPGAFSWLALSGLVGITVGDTAYFLALKELGAARTLLLSTLVPPLTAILAAGFLDEPLTGAMLIGMGLTLAGVTVVALERQSPGVRAATMGRVAGTGILFALAAVCCQSVANILIKIGGVGASPLGVSLVRIAAGGAGLALVLSLTRELSTSFSPLRRRRTLTAVVVASLLGTYLGIWLYTAGLLYTKAGIAVTLAATSPLFVLPIAKIVLKEPITKRTVLAALIAVVGVAVLVGG